MKMRKKCCFIIALIFLLALSACTSHPEADGGKFNVIFTYNYADAPDAEIERVAAGEDVQEPSIPTREGYRFLYWASNKAGTDAFDFNSKINSDTKLFAIWQATSAKVSFDARNGEEPIAQIVDVGESVCAPAANPVREHYSFDGWYADANGMNPFDFSTPIQRNTTIYAKWQQVIAAVSFDYGNGQSKEILVDIGENVSEPSKVPSREDYAFTGWYADMHCSEKFDFSEPVNKDTAVYAGWKQVVATVKLNPGYSEGETKLSKVRIGETLSEPAALEREGYDFDGWYADAALTMPVDFTQKVNGDSTIYAAWKARTYIVQFQVRGGTPVDNQEVTYGEHADYCETERSGYSFAGWYTDMGFETGFDFDEPITEDTVLYALWTKEGSTGGSQNNSGDAGGKQKLVLDLNYDGKILEEIRFDSTLIPSTKISGSPERLGYVFAGWYEDPECTNTANLKKTVNQTTTFYAKWNKTYTFEAEYVDFSGMQSNGYSITGEGPDAIITYASLYDNSSELVQSVSNGYFIHQLLYPNATVAFHVTASEDTSGVSIVLRLSPELYDMMWSGTQNYTVDVNGTRYYLNADLTGALGEAGRNNKRLFDNYVVTVSAELKKGDNVIRLITTNTDAKDGTWWASTPIIDCVYISADTQLRWTEGYCKPEQVGQTMADVEKSYDVKELLNYSDTSGGRK